MARSKAVLKLQERILRGAADARIYDLVRETPLSTAPAVSRLCGNRALVKREDLQRVFSFKIRGAFHKMTRIAPQLRARGVFAASAGNHAQGVALAAKHLGCPAAIYMPKHTQRIKTAAVREFGARIVLAGESVEEAAEEAIAAAKKNRATYIPPFDDEDIIAGNATVAAEILRQHPQPLRAVFCAVGGGGLVAGVGAYIKSLRPETKVIGVEAEESACMSASLAAGKIVGWQQPGIFADAVAVRKPGKLPFALAREFVDDMVVVNNDEICAAIKDLYDDTRVVFEPAGALAVAGLKAYSAKKKWQGETLAALACGANMNFDRLRFVAERAEIGENREAIFAATIPETPGSFRKFCALIGKRSITEFNYRMSDAKDAQIFVGVETGDSEERAALLKKLSAAGLPTLDLTGDEMAKLHVRHMVGGRANVDDEILYRFEFPERPGALMKFLTGLNSAGRQWNISLFHYRNHGADAGRVLAGIQVPPRERPRFAGFLRKLGYAFRDESDNPAYRLFLSQ